jgi:hypothetical protein
LVTPRFLYVTTISLSHLVPPICVNCRECRIQNLEQDRRFVAVTSFVSLKVITTISGSHRRLGRCFLKERREWWGGYAAARSIPLKGRLLQVTVHSRSQRRSDPDDYTRARAL